MTHVHAQILNTGWWIDERLLGITMMAAESDPPPPGDDTAPPADPPPADPPADDTPPPADTKPPAAPKPAAAADWRDRRIAELTARLRAEERKARAAPADGTQPPVVPPTTTQAELDRLVDQRAQERSAIQDYNRRCDEVFQAGQTAFSDFGDRVQNLQRLRDLSNPQDALTFNQFILAALETGSAPQVLHALGADLNEANRILSLAPVQMGVALARVADKLSAAAQETTAAPKPATPPAGGGNGPGTSHTAISPSDPDRADRLSTAEWMRRRNAQQDRWDAARR